MLVMLSRQRVLVAGATGYLGGFVAREFKSRGHFVRVLARRPQKLDSMEDRFDEIVEGEVTVPGSIQGICGGVDAVFSSVGITRQKDNLTFRDVDYQGNLNLLDVAVKAGVKKFIYVSVLNGPSLRHLDIVKAHEDFVDELRTSGLDYTIVRPTGYFSDMEEFLTMAANAAIAGTRIFSKHRAALAAFFVTAMTSDVVAPSTGVHKLKTHFEECTPGENSQS